MPQTKKARHTNTSKNTIGSESQTRQAQSQKGILKVVIIITIIVFANEMLSKAAIRSQLINNCMNSGKSSEISCECVADMIIPDDFLLFTRARVGSLFGTSYEATIKKHIDFSSAFKAVFACGISK